MSAHDRDPSRGLSTRLADAGVRAGRPFGDRNANAGGAAPRGASESCEELVRYLEELAGRQFRSVEQVRQFHRELSAQAGEARRIEGRRQLVKDTVLLFCLLSAFIQYHFLDVNLQISHLPSIVIFVPLDAGSPPHRRSAHAPGPVIPPRGRAGDGVGQA